MLKNAEPDSASFDHAEAERGRRGPRHRWELATELPFDHWDPWMQRYDEQVRDAHHFLELVAHSPVGAKQAEALYPQIVAAMTLDEDAAKVADLKIAVFGDLSPAEIVQRMGIDAAVLKTWEALFYDARQSRDRIGWVRTHIVDAELAAGRVDLATKLQLVAAIGSLGATTILDAGSRAPANEGERLFRRKLALHLKYDRAMAMTEGPKYDFQFTRHYSNLKMQERRMKMQERRLVEKCNEALMRHQLAEIRAQAALERTKVRAAKEARKVEEATLMKQGQRYAYELEAAHRIAMELAERKEAEALAAASPLARLCWKKTDQLPAKPAAVTVMPERQADVPVETPVSVPFTTLARPREVPVAATKTA